MTLSGAQAKWQLNTGATPTGIEVTGPNTIGVGLTTQAFSTADIAYSFKLASVTNTDSVRLTLSTGALSVLAGTPTISRWTAGTSDTAAEDFEGIALPALVTGYAGIVMSTAVGTVVMASSSAGNPDISLGTETVPIMWPLSPTGTIDFTFSAGGGDLIEMTVIGKSS